MIQQIDGDYLVRWCVCIKTSPGGRWGIYHVGADLMPLVFPTKRQATEKARELRGSPEHKDRARLFRAGRFFYSGEVVL